MPQRSNQKQRSEPHPNERRVDVQSPARIPRLRAPLESRCDTEGDNEEYFEETSEDYDGCADERHPRRRECLWLTGEFATIQWRVVDGSSVSILR